MTSICGIVCSRGKFVALSVRIMQSTRNLLWWRRLVNDEDSVTELILHRVHGVEILSRTGQCQCPASRVMARRVLCPSF